ncbi:MAG: hypothetical protein ACFFFH_07730 [Candidatus Thorarchaeota archaeon]
MIKLSKQDNQNLKHIFGPSNIHGKYGEDISPQVVYRIGQAFGTFLIEETELRNNAVYVGYDYCKISQILVDTLISGILNTGINVEFSGVPVLHGIAMFSALQRKDYASAFITASPLSADWTEIKFYYGNGVGFSPNNYREIRNIFLRGIFNKPPSSHMGQSQNVCLENKYKNHLISKFTLKKPIKVVIAGDHGSSCEFILQLLKDVGLNVDGLFNGLNKSSEPDRHSLELLAQKVRLEKADFGVNFDSDAEQAIIVDNVGRTISNDIIGLIMADHYLNKKGTQRRRILASVECSLALEKVLEPKKVIINRIQTGQTHLVENAIENPDTLLGMEQNLMVFPDLFPFHDAIPIPLKLAQVLTEDPRSLTKIVDSLPRIYRIQHVESCTDLIKFNVIDELNRECRSRFDTLNSGDDIRIKFGIESWVLIRASNTNPEIIITVEADSQNEAKRLMADFTLQVKDLIKNISKQGLEMS